MAENTGSQGKRGDLKKERKKSKTATAAVRRIQVKIRLKLEKKLFEEKACKNQRNLIHMPFIVSSIVTVQ